MFPYHAHIVWTDQVPGNTKGGMYGIGQLLS